MIHIEEKIDGYLSRLVQKLWPNALVKCLNDGRETWIVYRPGIPNLGIGDSFSQAKQAVHAILQANGNPGKPKKA